MNFTDFEKNFTDTQALTFQYIKDMTEIMCRKEKTLEDKIKEMEKQHKKEIKSLKSKHAKSQKAQYNKNAKLKKEVDKLAKANDKQKTELFNMSTMLEHAEKSKAQLEEYIKELTKKTKKKKKSPKKVKARKVSDSDEHSVSDVEMSEYEHQSYRSMGRFFSKLPKHVQEACMVETKDSTKQKKQIDKSLFSKN